MPWSGGNFTRANGNNGWVTDQTDGIGIEAGRHDTQDNDFKEGINFCLAKDGSNSAIGNLNLGNNKITALATATATTDAMPYGMIRDGAPLYLDKTNNRLGINTVSPQADLAITKTQTGATTAEYMRLTQSAAVDAATQRLGFYNYNGASASIDVIQNSFSNFQSQLAVSTNGGSGLTERLRITGAGKIGFGTSSPTSFYEFLRSANDNATSIGIVNANSGNNASCTFNMGTDVSLSAAGLIMNSSTNATNAGANGLTFFNNAGGKIVVVASTNGVQLLNGGNSWGAISDFRKKKNIQQLNYGLSHICQINPIRFDYLTDQTEQSERLGFIAQDLQPVIPESVHGSEDDYFSITTSDLIPVLVNAIKELNAKVEALQARVAELEK